MAISFLLDSLIALCNSRKGLKPNNGNTRSYPNLLFYTLQIYLLDLAFLVTVCCRKACSAWCHAVWTFRFAYRNHD